LAQNNRYPDTRKNEGTHQGSRLIPARAGSTKSAECAPLPATRRTHDTTRQLPLIIEEIPVAIRPLSTTGVVVEASASGMLDDSHQLQPEMVFVVDSGSCRD